MSYNIDTAVQENIACTQTSGIPLIENNT